jgi:hypothetical protein
MASRCLARPRHLIGNKKVVFLSAGRNSELEYFRSAFVGPGRGYVRTEPAAVGQQVWTQEWWQFEGAAGMFLRLKDRPDLLLRVEARLQALYQRRLKLEWAQTGLQVGFLPTTGGEPYYANAEARGLIQLIPLLAAVYDDDIGALLVDKPEISMHPQVQAFLLQEMEAYAGEPTERGKKLIVLATHSPTMLPVGRIRDIPCLVFFADRHTAPIQIDESAEELRNAKLGALVARLNEAGVLRSERVAGGGPERRDCCEWPVLEARAPTYQKQFTDRTRDRQRPVC